MTKQQYQHIFLILTKCILTTLTGTVLWIFVRTAQMTCSMDPAFYLTVPEQTTHVLAGLMVYVIFACAGSYAVGVYDT
ncbi:MAG: hypothetical protein IJ325_03025 [Clostridia bacterium]|nr:hypothetical protein [Clostridia bacterium]